MQFGNFLEVVTFISAILTIILVLLQQRGASLGAGFGSSGERSSQTGRCADRLQRRLR